MDIDKLFKRPNLPASALKTKHGKLAPIPPSIVAHSDAGGEPSSSHASHIPAPSVTDVYSEKEAEEEEMEEGVFVNPEEDEEDARLFGGGLSSQQEQIAQILNRDQSDQATSGSQAAMLRKQIVRFERAVTKNQQLRVKFAHDPHKYIESEADLDGEITALTVLTAAPGVLYKEALAQGLPASLCGLLSHENEDIVASIVRVLEELTDEDVLDGVDDEDVSAGGGTRREAEASMAEFVKELRDNQLIELLVSNLDRFRKNLNENENLGAAADQEEEAQRAATLEADEQAVYHIFALLENLVGFDGAGVSPVLVRNRTFWEHIEALLRQGRGHYLAKAKGKDSEAYTQNEAYAAELLSIVVQAASAAASSAPAVLQPADKPPGLPALAVGGCELGGTNTLLESLSPFLRATPHGDEEKEVAQNLFDALCALMSDDHNRLELAQREGADLLVLLLSEPKHSTRKKHGVTLLKKSALRLLSYALSGHGEGTQAMADAFVSAGGLKPLFAVLAVVKSKHASSLSSADEEHLLSVLVALLNFLSQESVARIRLLAKFTEHDYASLERLVTVRVHAASRLLRGDQEYSRLSLAESPLKPDERTEDQEMDHLLRLEQGLFALEAADYVIAWLCVEDDGMRVRLAQLLRHRHNSASLVKDVVTSLQAYYYDLGDTPVSVLGAVPPGLPAPNQKQVVVDLVNALLE